MTPETSTTSLTLPPAGAPVTKLAVRRIQSSYLQVADQLRDLVVRGDLIVGQRLPPEPELAALFGVSRSTIREALRILVTDGLLVTKRGVQGGTFVAELDGTRIEELLGTAFNVLAQTHHVTAGDFLEAWRAIDVPAARLAARRRPPEALADLERTSRPMPADADRAAELAQSGEFHAVMLRMSGNVLLEAMGRPVTRVARARFAQTAPSEEFWLTMADEHRRIYEAIAAGDEELAQLEAARHVDNLRPFYGAVSD